MFNVESSHSETRSGGKKHSKQVRSFPPRQSSEDRFSSLTNLDCFSGFVFCTFQQRRRSELQHGGVGMSPKEQAGARPQRINGENKWNKETKKDLQVTMV